MEQRKQTAVEWMINKLEDDLSLGMKQYDSIIKQAKAMEKEQILNACHHGVDYDKSPYKNAEEYYKETYGK